MDQLKCPICMNTITTQCKPIALPCGHSYCKKCLKNLIAASKHINFSTNDSEKQEFFAPTQKKTYSVMWCRKGVTYFFKQDMFYAYDDSQDKVYPGFPVKIASFWKGIWPNGFDTCFNYDERYSYFVKGNKCIKYNMIKMKVEHGYPMKIRKCWSGINEDSIDAIARYPNKLYFFVKDYYYRYDINYGSVDAGYPLKIKDNWRGIWDANIEAITFWTIPNKLYFFKNNQYIRFDIVNDVSDPGYPTNLCAWHGIPNL